MYTGASSWYYKAVTEHLLGIRLKGDRVEFAPCIPSEWQEFELNLNLCGTPIHVSAKRGDDAGMTVNGSLCNHLLLDGVPKEVRLTFVSN